MGDRCYMTLTIGGDISDVDSLDTLVDAIASEGGGGSKAVRESFIAALANGDQPYFEFEEVNYADLDCFGVACEMGLDALTFHGAGDDYAAGHESHNGLTGETFQWGEAEEGMILIEVIQAVINTHHPAERAIEKLQEELNKVTASEWKDLRPFTVSGTTADALAAEVARHKIEKAA